MDEVKNHMNDLEHKELKISHAKQEVKRFQKNEDSLKSFWNNFKKYNICLIGDQKGEQKEIGNLAEKTVKENFPNLVKEIDIQVQEVQRIQVMMDAKRPTPRRVIIKRPKVKDKERLLKAREKKLVTRLPDGRGVRENE